MGKCRLGVFIPILRSSRQPTLGDYGELSPSGAKYRVAF